METSRVYRQVVTVEIIAIVPPDAKLPADDWESMIRDAVMANADTGKVERDGGITYNVPGETGSTDWIELDASRP